MASVIPNSSSAQLDEMHTLYRQGGADRMMAPHVVYPEAGCPHDGCRQNLQAIDFRLEAFGRAIHDPLVRAWWDDVGFPFAFGRWDPQGFTLIDLRAMFVDGCIAMLVSLLLPMLLPRRRDKPTG